MPSAAQRPLVATRNAPWLTVIAPGHRPLSALRINTPVSPLAKPLPAGPKGEFNCKIMLLATSISLFAAVPKKLIVRLVLIVVVVAGTL